MNVEIFDAVSNHCEWNNELKKLPLALQDVYFLPEYVKFHRTTPRVQAVMFKLELADKIWLYPFLMSPILRIGEIIIEEKYFDIETAYGYGGPLSNCEDSDFLAAAHQEFLGWCSKQNIVAEFIRLHPLLKNERWLSPDVELSFVRESVSLDLTRLNEVKLPFDKTASYMISRARRLGVETKISLDRDDFFKFVKLYFQTMERISAESYYFFSEEYFNGLQELTSSSGFLVIAKKDALWLSAAVFLKGTISLHYHLSASDIQRRLPGSSNLVIFFAANIGRECGLKILHLGGGRPDSSKEDSLLNFKRSMSTDTHRCYIGKRIHNRQAYIKLRKIWEEQYPDLSSAYGNRLLCYRYGK